MSQWARGFFKEADLHARMLSKSSNEGVQTESDISLFLLLPLVLSLSLSLLLCHTHFPKHTPNLRSQSTSDTHFS